MDPDSVHRQTLNGRNVEVAIPNAMVMNDHIVNYSTRADELGVTLHTAVTIGYDVPWPKVHELLIEAARRTERIQSGPEPFVFRTSLDDNYVACELNAITRKPSGKNKIYSDIHAIIRKSTIGR
jgi:small-conductance mechanosensitive channel